MGYLFKAFYGVLVLLNTKKKLIFLHMAYHVTLDYFTAPMDKKALR